MFRAEALAHHQDHRHGTVLVTGLPRPRLLLAGVCCVPLLLLAFGTWGKFTRKEHVVGVLVPSAGLVRVASPQAGEVIQAMVSEGQVVHQGDVLLVLSSERSTTTTRDTQAAIQREVMARRDRLAQELSQQAEIDTLTTAALTQRIQGLQAQMAQAEEQVAAQRGRVASAQRTLERHESLVASQFITSAALQQKQEELMDQRGQLASLLRNVTALSTDLANARSEHAASGLKRHNNASAIERQLSELTQQLTEGDARRSVVLTAPIEGTVTTVLTAVGQAASAGAPLLSILPAGSQLEAQLLVPSRAIGFIQAGQEVALRYQAFPYQRFGHAIGRIQQIGRTVIQPNEAGLPVLVSEPVYRVTVRLPAQRVEAYGRTLPLQSGMAIDADVWIDRRSILEWVLDPLFSVTGRV